jgi:hypothetical protein
MSREKSAGKDCGKIRFAFMVDDGIINSVAGESSGMRKESTVLMIIFMAFFIILSAGIAGCTSQAPPASPAPDDKLSTIEPSQMALQPSDMPGNYTLVERAGRLSSEMRNWSLDHGWKKGYYTVYQKNGENPSAGIVSQSISIYPPENMSLVMQDTTDYAMSWAAANITVEQLTVPAVGDSRTAFRLSEKGDPIQEYLIIFAKKDVYEEMSTNGTESDYTALTQLTQIAAAKIK